MTDWFSNIANIESGALEKLLLFDHQNPLLFNSGLFMFLIVGVLGLYSLLRRWRNARMLFIIAFSLYFYYKSSAGYCLILLGVCMSDFIIGQGVGKAQSMAVKRLLVVLNVFLNVGMLVYFKYFNMLYETFANMTRATFDPLDIILPAGISFFCFRSISYIVDIYRGKIQPCGNFLEYTFFLTFFPPLLAGPVVRARDMMPQIQADVPATRKMVSEGLVLIMAGLIKKVVIADFIAAGFIDRVFENPSLYSGFENVLAIIGFSIQLYCDFSGYSDMAIGLALLMGYRFAANFDAPYKSQNPTEFWRRWHISLSSWLREYIYIPLGGNRKGVHRQRVNLLSTMVIGGLWHGASWMYVLWGAYHGVLLAGHKYITRVLPAPEALKGTRINRVFNITLTFILMAIGFAIFRAPSLEHLQQMGEQISTSFHPEIIKPFIEGYLTIVVAIVTAYVLHFLPSSWNRRTYKIFDRLPWLAQAVILAAVIFIVIQTRQSDLVPFLYLKY